MVSEQQVFTRATPYLMGALGLCALTIFLMMMLVVYVIALRHKSWKALRNIAYRDTLTGARNWRRMIIDMEAQLDKHPERQYARGDGGYCPFPDAGHDLWLRCRQ